MKLQTYLDKTKKSVHSLAQQSGVTPSTIYKFLSGEQKSIKPHIARAISEATEGQVGLLDLLFPDEKVQVSVKVGDE